MDGILKRVRPHVEASGVEAALERARAGMESLAGTAAELEARLPAEVGSAVREGLRAEALPVGRDLAELRGLAARTTRTLERIEGELAAERRARIDDLALLVELVTAGWQGVDERLRRIEAALERPPLRAAS